MCVDTVKQSLTSVILSSIVIWRIILALKSPKIKASALPDHGETVYSSTMEV